MRTMQCYGLVISLLISGFAAEGIKAQAYPSKPIRIQTTGAGGGTDIAARVVAAEMSAPLGQQIVIENHPNTATLASGVAKSAPDGYNLLIWGGAFWLAPLFDEVNYDPLRDFTPIVALSRSPNSLIVHPSLGVKSMAELIKLAKSRPGQINFSSGPTGSSSQIAGELLKSMAGVDIVLIPYKGGSRANTDLLSGQVPVTVGQASAMASEIKAGKLLALATAGPRRSALYPDLPTMTETLPGFVSEALFGLFGPASTPEAIVNRLNQEVGRALQKPEVRQRLLATGQEPVGGTPEQLTEYMRSDIERVGKVSKDIKAKGS